MFFLRSCRIIFDDLSTKSVNECDGLTSLFTMPNVNSVDILVLLVAFLVVVYFILKIILLFKGGD